MPDGFRLQIDQAELRSLVADLKQLEGGKKQVTQLRRTLTAAAAPAKSQVQANASWSTRIPGAVGVQVRFTAKKVGVSIFINRKKAPHARPIENDGKTGTFKHPLFARRGRLGRALMVKQQARPFFFNDLARHMPAVEAACVEAIDTAARDAGFR